MESDGTIAKLFEIFLNKNYKDIKTNIHAAVSIGLIFKAYPIPDKYNSIINYLKSLNNEKSQDGATLIAFIRLAECQCIFILFIFTQIIILFYFIYYFYLNFHYFDIIKQIIIS